MGPYKLASFISGDGFRDTSPELRRADFHFSDLESWAHTLLPDIASTPGPEPGSYFTVPGPSQTVAIGDTWTNQIVDYQSGQQSQHPLNLVNDVEEEDSGIRLVHALLTCAEAIQCGEFPLAASLIHQMSNELLTRVNTARGIGKVAGYFVEALSRRLYQLGHTSGPTGPGPDYEILYHHFYEVCPYLKFAHFTANQAILEALDGHDFVHVIDFSLMQGLQWPPLIQALALRPGGPPSLRLTGIGPTSGNGPYSLREIGLRLAQLAQSVNMPFAFRAVAASRLEDIKPWMLETSPTEALAVNSILQLHRLLGSGIDPVLEWIRTLNPKIMTLIEQEANHNQPEFLPRFTEALYYYSTLFDSLEFCQIGPEKAQAELYLQREISNIVCCEGRARVERHEPLDKWRVRMGRAGFKPVDLGQNALKQASMLLTLFSAEGYCVQETNGCLTLGWHSHPLIAASAWQVGPIMDRSSSSSSSS